MRKNAVIVGIIGLFYLAMAGLTIGSRRMYLKKTPKVLALQPSQTYFQVDGQSVTGYLLPKECATGPVYVLERREKNGQIRVYAREVLLEFYDGERNGCVVVKSGLSMMDVVIAEGMEHVVDGGEVLVENKDEIKFW